MSDTQGIDAGLRDLLERVKSNLYNAFEPNNQSRLYLDVEAALAPPDLRKDLALETLETIANAEWMVDSCAQELAKQALAEMRGAKR